MEVSGDEVGDVDFEADQTGRIGGIGFDVRGAAFGIAAPDQGRGNLGPDLAGRCDEQERDQSEAGGASHSLANTKYRATGARMTQAPIASHATVPSSAGAPAAWGRPPAADIFGQTHETTAAINPTSAAAATACAMKIGRTAARWASARARTCARHHTW